MELIKPIVRNSYLIFQRDVKGFLDVLLKLFYLVNSEKLFSWNITHHSKIDFDAKMS